MKRTTKKQFELFKNSFCITQKDLSLEEYDVLFTLERIDAYATIEIDHTGMVATATLLNEYAEDDPFDPVLFGVHEAIHLMNAEIEYFAMQRFTTEESVGIANERIVRRLTRSIILKPYIEELRKRVR